MDDCSETTPKQNGHANCAPVPVIVSSFLRKQLSKGPLVPRSGEVDSLCRILGIQTEKNAVKENGAVENGHDRRQFPVAPSTTTAVLRGLPGVGKTTLMAMLCHRGEVRSFFADGGITWVNLGDVNMAEIRIEAFDDEGDDTEGEVSWPARASGRSGLSKAVSRPKDGHTNGKNALLGFGAGLQAMTLETQCQCYTSICLQLNMQIPPDLRVIKENGAGKGAMEDARQIMANAFHSWLLSRSASNESRPRILLLLDDLWNLNDMEWFQFGSLENTAVNPHLTWADDAQTNPCFYVMATTRTKGQFPTATCRSVDTLSPDESTQVLLGNVDADEMAASQSDEQDDPLAARKLLPNLQMVVSRIAAHCGNVPFALSSCCRWVDNIQSTTGGNAGNGMEDLAAILDTTNFFEHDPETDPELDFFHVVDRTFSPKLHGSQSSRILKLCLIAFTVVFQREASSGGPPSNSEGNVRVPTVYAKELWDKLLQSALFSGEERRIFDDSDRRRSKRVESFTKLRDAFILLGVMEEVTVQSKSGRHVLHLQLTHRMYRQYAEFLFYGDDGDDEDDAFGIFERSPPKESLEEKWNEFMANYCESQTGQWESWSMLHGLIDDHLFVMLPVYMIRARMFGAVSSLLGDRNFIRGRLNSLGYLEGTKIHIGDCDQLAQYSREAGTASGSQAGETTSGLDVKNTTTSSYSKLVAVLHKDAAQNSDGAAPAASDSVLKDAALAVHAMSVSLLRNRWWEEALQLAEQCLLMKKKAFGDEHAEVSKTLHNIGLMHEQLDDLDSALEQYQAALRIGRLALGNKHSDVAKMIQCIGKIHVERKESHQAIDCFTEALEIRKLTLGENSEESADTLSCLGMAHEDAESYDLALKCYRESLRVKQLVLGDDDVACAEMLYNIAVIYKAMKQYDKAVRFFQEALRIFKVAGMDRDHPEVVEAHLFINWALSNERRKEST